MRKKRVLSLLLALCLVVGTGDIPVYASVSAGDAEVEIITEETVTEETGTEDGGTEESLQDEIPAEEANPEKKYYNFTDDTGMEVTFEALTDTQYQYTVEDGVLKSVLAEDGSPLSGNIEIPADWGVTAIGANVFQSGNQVTYVKLPEGVITIEDGAFSGMTYLKGMYLPNGLLYIENSAFKGCTGLTQIAIPKTVKTIGEEAFMNDEKLFMVYMKDMDNSVLEGIGAGAFKSCKALGLFCSDTEFLLPKSLLTIGEYAFAGCKGIKKLTLPEKLETLGEGAFSLCDGMESVVLSGSVSAIPAYAFDGCSNLLSVTFADGNESIGTAAFKDCIQLTSVDLMAYIDVIGESAFAGCSNLVMVRSTNSKVEVGQNAFPNTEKLTLFSVAGSTFEKYTQQEDIKIQFAYVENPAGVYKCTCDVVNNGTIVVRDGNNTEVKEAAYGTELYIWAIPDSTDKYELVEGSVKVNGVPAVKKSEDDIFYTFVMPVGGVRITAEFRAKTTTDKLAGTKDQISAEVSYGAVTDEENKVIGAELKAGQYTRMFLIDEKDNNKTVAADKITFLSSKPSIATVDSQGVIRAVKDGTCIISATAIAADGEKFTKKIYVDVYPINVKRIQLNATDYQSDKVTINTEGEIGYAVVEKAKLDKEDISFTIKATIYDEDEDDSKVDLKWSTSDSKVAALKMKETLAATPENEITIPKGASGEATITITATNADGKTVSKKMIVSIKDYTPRLVEDTVVINTNSTENGYLRLLKAYGKEITPSNVKLLDENGLEITTYFTFRYVAEMSDEDVYCFEVAPRRKQDLGTYNLTLSVNDYYKMKVTVKVVKQEPNPNVSLSAKQTKINLFYGNDGTEVIPVITNLNGVEISKYSLEALSDSDDDKLFLENFEVDPITGVITQKSESMKYTSKGKPAVSGYLVLRFAGYEDSVVKKYKITIPTMTAAPSYVLDRTSDTFNVSCIAQDVTLRLLDNKNKKQPVELDEHYNITVLPNSVDSIAAKPVVEDGKIVLKLKSNCKPGRIYLEVSNDTWASGKTFKYTYTIRTATTDPKITLVKSSVSVNALYPEQITGFALKSNQCDTRIAENQTFVGMSTTKNAAEYAKLSVKYENGEGTIQVLDSSIAKGTYTFNCNQVKRLNAKGEEVDSGKVTLRVTINKNLPTVSVSGKAALNVLAEDEYGNYVDTGAFTLTPKNLPADYALNEEETFRSISCNTKGYENYEKHFLWGYDGQKIMVSLKDEIPAKTYNFSITPAYTYGDNTIYTKTIKINVSVTKKNMAVTMTGKGKINLLDRNPEEYTDKNSIIYTARLTNFSDTIVEARVYDATTSLPSFDDEESSLFEAKVIDGKVYVTPIPGAKIENGKAYAIKLWVKFANCAFSREDGYGVWVPGTGTFTIKTAQTLPKVAADKSNVNLYLANKNYTASFVIKKTDLNAVGALDSVKFDEKDTNALETFDLEYEKLENGDLLVKLKLKDTVSYGCNTTNKLTFYTVFEGQGSNTSGTPVSINVRINK